MKTLNEYLNEAYKPKASDDHKALIFNMLTNEYKANNDKIMQALSDSDDKFFKNLVNDYTTFVLGYFGAGDETAEKVKKEAQEGVTAFKATVKLGMHENNANDNGTLNESVIYDDAVAAIDKEIKSNGTESQKWASVSNLMIHIAELMDKETIQCPSSYSILGNALEEWYNKHNGDSRKQIHF